MSPFGFINCDKPIGMTSRDVVNIVSGCLRKTKVGKKVKVGHAGTLDPLAEGVLVLAIGRAVRLVPYVQQQAKRYQATFVLGQTSDTGDMEGALTLHLDQPRPTRDQLETAAASLTGQITQIPPAYSAIKIGGKRAYDLARGGHDFEMPKRQVEVHHLRVTRYDYPQFDLDVGCGSGTYIRTLGMDLAAAIGSVSVMKHLRRTAIGVFCEDDSVPVEKIRKLDPRDFLRPAMDGVCLLPQVLVDDAQSKRLFNGLDLDLKAVGRDGQTLTEGELIAVWQDEVIAVLVRRNTTWWPRRVFPCD